jgi:hypothetical protein
MTDHHIIEPYTFDFYADFNQSEPIVGMRINGLLGESATYPLNADTAERVAEILSAHVRMFRDLPRAVTPAKARMLRYPAAAAK